VDKELQDALDILEARLKATAAPKQAGQLAQRLQSMLERVVDRLDENARADEGDPDALTARLQRQSESIAEDLRRIDTMTRERQSGQ